MNLARPGWWILCLCGCLPLPAVSHAATPSAPFIQFVTLVDFQLLETNNDLALSPSNQLVICFPNFERSGAVDRAVALRRATGGKWQLSYLVADPARGPRQFRREEAELDPVIARNVFAIVNHLLAANARQSTGALHRPSEDDDAWIFVHGDRAVATGVTSNGALQRTGGDDVAIYRDVCAGLVGIFVAPEERSRVITQLDRLTVRYIELKKLARD